MELLSWIKIRCLLQVKLVLMFVVLQSISSYSQGFGDNLFFIEMNPEFYFSQQYSYDNAQNNHSFKHDKGPTSLFSPSIVSSYELIRSTTDWHFHNAISSHSGEYLAQMKDHKLIVGDPFKQENINILDLMDGLKDYEIEGVNSCYPFIGYNRHILNLNDSLLAFLECRNCVSHRHFNQMIRDSTDFYFRGKKVNQKALLIHGNYYQKLVPRLVRIHRDKSLELLDSAPYNIPIMEGFFAGTPILIKHADGKRWWILLPKAHSNSAAVFLTSYESIEYSHESYFPSIDPSNRDYQYTYRNYHSGKSCNVSPNGNFIAFYRYLNHIDFNSEISIYRFDRCSGKLGDLFTEYFTPIQQLSSSEMVDYPLWSNQHMSQINEDVKEMISEMYLAAQELNLNYGEDSLYWHSFAENIFFSNTEDQVIFRDPYRNFIRCKLNPNSDFVSSCEVVNDLIIKNTILNKPSDEDQQTGRWNSLIQLPNSNLLLTNTIYYENLHFEEEHSIVEFNSNRQLSPSIRSLYYQPPTNASYVSHLLPLTRSSLISPIHYRMPPLERDCDFTEPDQPQFTLYPNPSPGQFYIQSTDANIYFQSLEVFSMSGIKVYNKVLNPEQTYSEIHGDISYVPPGIYIVVLRDIFGATKFTSKFVKVE